MEHARFWSVIDEAKGSAEALTTTLASLPQPDIAAFDAWFWAYYLAIAREDLWAAVYAILGGCSDDGFDYFRSWLIGRGEHALLAAIRDPESLAELVGDEDPRNERLLGAARRAYEGELPDREMPAIPGRETWPADRFKRGTKWTDAFFAKHYPKLHDRYIANPTAKKLPAIPQAQFWALMTKATAGANDPDEAEARLIAVLHELDRETLIGFERWLYAYENALRRDNVKRHCKDLLGADDPETFSGFRGWLVLQGRDVVYALLRKNALPSFAHTPASRRRMTFITLEARERHGISGGFEPETLNDVSRVTAPVPITPEAPHRVRHPKFGDGTVVSVDTSASEPKLVIDFPSGRKTIAKRFVEVIE
jgi:hypothetical protein